MSHKPITDLITIYTNYRYRIIYKVTMQTYRALNADALQYLRHLMCTADIPSQQRLLQYSATNSLFTDFLLLDVTPFLLLVHV